MTTRTISAARPLFPAMSLAGLATRFIAMDTLWRQRRALARMDAAGLRDVGLNPRSAHAEAKKPIWNAPNHWQC